MNFKITTVKSFVFAGFLTIASDASAGINYLIMYTQNHFCLIQIRKKKLRVK